MSQSLLLKNGHVITMDVDRRVLAPGWLLIEGDRISGLGPMTECPSGEMSEVLDLRGQTVLPGLINAHNHHWGSLFKNTGEGLSIDSWLRTIAFPLLRVLSTEDLRIASYLSCFEQLLTGTTCSVNHLTNSNDLSSLRAIADPVVEVGSRQLIAKELRDPRVVPLAPGGQIPARVRSRSDELSLAEAAIDEFDGLGGLITMGLALESGSGWMLHNTTSDEILVEGAELAARKNVRISDHCSGGSDDFRRLTGGSEVDYLANLGVLSDRWIFVHGIGLSHSDIAQLATSKASLITNPVSNSYVGSGVAPLQALIAGGVNVGIGSDGAYVNGTQDMVQQMKFLALLQNSIAGDPSFLSSERVLHMATRGNAAALGLLDEIGSLEVGKKADVAVFDMTGPHVGIPNRTIGAMVYSLYGIDASTVIVDGVVRVRDGRLTYPGVDEAFEEGASRSRDALQRAGLSSRIADGWQSYGSVKAV